MSSQRGRAQGTETNFFRKEVKTTLTLVFRLDLTKNFTSSSPRVCIADRQLVKFNLAAESATESG